MLLFRHQEPPASATLTTSVASSGANSGPCCSRPPVSPHLCPAAAVITLSSEPMHNESVIGDRPGPQKGGDDWPFCNRPPLHQVEQLLWMARRDDEAVA